MDKYTLFAIIPETPLSIFLHNFLIGTYHKTNMAIPFIPVIGQYWARRCKQRMFGFSCSKLKTILFLFKVVLYLVLLLPLWKTLYVQAVTVFKSPS